MAQKNLSVHKAGTEKTAINNLSDSRGINQIIASLKTQEISGQLQEQSTSSSYTTSLRNNTLSFTENKGQIVDLNKRPRPDILYRGESNGATIYLRKIGISYVLDNLDEVTQQVEEESILRGESSGEKNNDKTGERKRMLMENKSIMLHRVDVDFVGSNENVANSSSERVEGYDNYYYAHCPEGITDVGSFNEVTVRDIYKNIDVKYYGGKSHSLKYDIVVNPGADPKQIKLRYSGAENIYINQSGNLIIKTSIREFSESMPKVYQNINGKIVDVKAAYILNKEKRNSRSGIKSKELPSGSMPGTPYNISFALGKYNKNFPLVIDPETWITYYGGNSRDGAHSVAVDNNGNAIFSGVASSANFPVSAGAHQMASDGGFFDGCIVKMDAAGGRVFATFFGGTSADVARGIDTDSKNDIYLAGYTLSVDLPTKAWGGAWMTGMNKDRFLEDAFIAKFSSTGALIWSTYFGGSGYDLGIDVITDSNDNIIFSGNTNSIDFPTRLPFQAEVKGRDLFAAKFNNAGVLQWSSYYGGSGIDNISGVSADSSNNIYMTGSSQSVNFPVVSAFQSIFGGGGDALLGGGDAFLMRLNPSDGFPVWSTYYGNDSNEYGQAVAADALGNIYLTICSNSGQGIATAGTYQTNLKGEQDAALIKFTNEGKLVWGTYLGGSLSDQPSGLAVDDRNNIIVSGQTRSIDFPVTDCAYQTNFRGPTDRFISTFDRQGKLICSGYIGVGDSLDLSSIYSQTGGSIAVSGSFVYMSDVGRPYSYPATAGAYQEVCGGKTNLALSRLCIYTCGLSKAADISFNNNSCSGQTQKVNYKLARSVCDTSSTTYLWTFLNGNPSASTAKNPDVIYNTPGTYTAKLVLNTACGEDSVTKSILISSQIVTNVDAGEDVSICKDRHTILCASGGENYFWTPSEGLSNPKVQCPVASPKKTTSYTVRVSNTEEGCYAFASLQVTVVDPTECQSLDLVATESKYAFVVSPNPVRDSSILEFNNQAILSLRIHNYLGEIIHEEEKISGDAFRISKSNYKPGLYFIKLRTNLGTFTTRFMVE